MVVSLKHEQLSGGDRHGDDETSFIVGGLGGLGDLLELGLPHRMILLRRIVIISWQTRIIFIIFARRGISHVRI